MDFKTKFIEHDSYLEVYVTGQYNVDGGLKDFENAISTARKKNYSKILINYRELKGEMAATEKAIFGMGIIETYKKHILSDGHNIRIAFVGTPEFVTTYKPALEIFKQNNLPFTIVTDIIEAYKWLNIE